MLDFRAECRAYAAHWMAVQARRIPPPGRRGRLGATATPPWTMPSEGAIAGEICKFLLNGALYRGLRPVMWSPVEKTALAEAEIEYHDHTSDDDLGALPDRGLRRWRNCTTPRS